MARKKKKPGFLKNIFSEKKKKRGKRKGPDTFVAGLRIVLSIMFLTILIAGGAIGLIYMDRYVSKAAKEETDDGYLKAKEGPLKLINCPTWVNQEWVDTLIDAAGGKRFPLDKGWAQEVATRLATLSWLNNVQVQTTPEFLTVEANYRRPVALVRSSRKKQVYLDADMIVIDYIPVTSIPVIEVKGLATTNVPEAGQEWLAKDAKAAVELLNLLYTADLHFQQEKRQITDGDPPLIEKKVPEKPLLNEIKSIDVSNFAARKSRSAPNIILNVTDGTKVHWGAAWGQANVYFEAEEKDKLARLYQFFMDHQSTLEGAAKYIELRWPQDSIPRPR
jgi:hypothetical protein